MHSKKFMEGGGEMGALTRAHDWSSTSLGPVENWPQSLCIAVSILLSSKFPMFLWWGPDLIQFYNDAYRPSLGNNGKHPSALGQKGEECWPEIWPVIKPLIDQVLTGGGATWSEDQLIPIYRNGQMEEVYWTFGYSPVADESGKIGGVLVVCTETTEKINTLRAFAESEKNVRQIFSNAPVAITFLRGPEFIVEIANNPMLEIWGKESGQVIKKPLLMGIPEIKEQGIEALLRNVFETGVPFIAKEYPVQLYRKGKLETVYVNFVYEAFRDTDGIITGIVAVAAEITEEVLLRKSIEETVEERTQSLKDANQQLKRSNAELEQFAYVASHDLQEPLRKIKTFAGMLNNSLSDVSEKEKGFLEKIISSTERMAILIDDVLTFSRLSEKVNNTVKTDLNEILQKVKEDLELEMEKRNVVITADKLPAIMALPVQMNQLFFNLLSNSLKFSRNDEPLKINISAQELDKEAIKSFGNLNENTKYLEIIFSDNGIGFDQGFADKIFNIFHRLNGRAYSGSGIGLALCRRIVSNHGGELFAVSEENKGAAFHVILPMMQVFNEVPA